MRPRAAATTSLEGRITMARVVVRTPVPMALRPAMVRAVVARKDTVALQGDVRIAATALEAVMRSLAPLGAMKGVKTNLVPPAVM